MPWGYTKERGPQTWQDQYPQAGGLRQSPIDIESSNTTIDPILLEKPLRFDYDPYKSTIISNSGFSWKVQVENEGSVLEGGPLKQKYRLEQFHFHWGKTNKTGSEHTVDGKPYPAEVHLVHWNTELYESFDDAAQGDDGLAVLGAFLEIGEEHVELKKLTNLLEQVKHRGEESKIPEGFDPTSLLPDELSYWTYEGSLTTPPCYESVTWIVFKKPIQVSEEQMEQFRQLRSYCRHEDCPNDEFEGQIVENYRPPLPLGDRMVRECCIFVDEPVEKSNQFPFTVSPHVRHLSVCYPDAECIP